MDADTANSLQTLCALRQFVIPHIGSLKDRINVTLAFHRHAVPYGMLKEKAEVFLGELDDYIRGRDFAKARGDAGFLCNLLLFQSELRGLVRDLEAKAPRDMLGETWEYYGGGGAPRQDWEPTVLALLDSVGGLGMMAGENTICRFDYYCNMTARRRT